MGVNRLFVFLVVLFLAVSCGRYNDLLTGGDYDKKYEAALQYYNMGSYLKASKLFDQTSGVFRGTSRGDSSSYFQAYCAYHMNDYQMAGYYFEQFVTVFPMSEHAEEASYMSAYCKYLQSPRYDLDQGATMSAIEALVTFVTNHPASEHALLCIDMVEELENRIVEKSYESARLYFLMEEYKSSIVALENSLKDYPDTKYRQEMMYMILESKYYLALYSVQEKQLERYQDAADEYISFISEFPEYRRGEVDKMYAVVSQYVEE